MANLDEIRRHLPEELTPSQRERGKYICPLCGSGSHGRNSTAAFSIDRDGVHGKCFSCGFYGDIFDLVAQRDGLSLEEATRNLVDKYEPGARRERSSAAADFAPTAPRAPAISSSKAEAPSPAKSGEIMKYIRRAHSSLKGSDGERYLLGRGLTPETLERFSAGYDPRCYNKKIRRTVPSVVIPYPGAAYYITRPLDSHDYDKPKVDDAGSEPIFNAGALYGGAEVVFVVESQVCAMSIEQLQLGGAAIAMGGCGERRLLDLLKSKPTEAVLVLSLDNDPPGQALSSKLETLLTEAGIMFIKANISGSMKDPNELLAADAGQLASNITAAITAAKAQRDKAEAERLDSYNGESNSGFIDGFFEAVERSKSTPAIPTGFPSLDRLLDGGLFSGLYVLGAITSLGKSTLALQIADNIAASGHDVIFIALEMSRQELIAKSLSRLTWQVATADGLPAETVRKRAKTVRGILSGKRWEFYSREEVELIAAATDKYKADISSHIWIHEGVGNIGVEAVRGIVERHISITGRLPVLFVDYVQILAPVDMRASDKQNTDKAVLELKRLSRDKGIPVVGISSLNRDNYTQPINNAAFKESGSLEYGSDCLLGLQFEGMDYEAGEADKTREKRIRDLVKEQKSKGNSGGAEALQLKVLKNRNGRSGTDMSLAYYPMFNVYTDGEFKEVDSSEAEEIFGGFDTSKKPPRRGR